MESKEIFNEIMKSPRLKELLGVPADADIHEDFNTTSQSKEVTVIRNIIEGQMRHTSEDSLFKSIVKLYDF